MQSADHAHRRRGVQVGLRVEGGDELADALGCVGLAPEEVDELEARVVVRQDERVLEVPERRPLEWPYDVGVHEAPGVRR